jgi:hypothetical protein
VNARYDWDAMGRHCIGMPCTCIAAPCHRNALPPHAAQMPFCCQCKCGNLAMPDLVILNAGFLIFSLRCFAASVIARIWQCRI